MRKALENFFASHGLHPDVASALAWSPRCLDANESNWEAVAKAALEAFKAELPQG